MAMMVKMSYGEYEKFGYVRIPNESFPGTENRTVKRHGFSRLFQWVDVIICRIDGHNWYEWAHYGDWDNPGRVRRCNQCNRYEYELWVKKEKVVK